MNKDRWDRILAYKRLYCIAGTILLADIFSKWWVLCTLPFNTYHPDNSITIIDGFFYIVHIGNEGAAWGIFSGYSGWLALFAIIVLIAIYYLRHTLELQRPLHQIAFGFLIGGVLGNLIDRIVHGHVIDFLDFHFPFSIPWILENGRYPSFNIADSGIVIGVFIYLILSFRASPADSINN
jgi:signal peptidase II